MKKDRVACANLQVNQVFAVDFKTPNSKRRHMHAPQMYLLSKELKYLMSVATQTHKH